jgi:hypothetical protein
MASSEQVEKWDAEMQAAFRAAFPEAPAFKGYWDLPEVKTHPLLSASSGDLRRADINKLIGIIRRAAPRPGVTGPEGPKAPSIVPWDIDSAESLCNSGRSGGNHCVYWQTAEGPDGWYVTVVIDSESGGGGFVDNLATDDGPYATEAEAHCAGLHTAADWFYDNNVRFTQKDYKAAAQGCDR